MRTGTTARSPFPLPAAAAVVAIIALMTGVRAVWADGLDAWYRSDPHSANYADARAGLVQVFSEARQQHVPQWLLVDRLREGSAKGAPSDILVRAMHAELARLERAHTIVDQVGLTGVSASARDATLKEIGVFLRAGLPDHLVGELLAAGRGLRGGRESALAACGAVMDLRAVAPVADADSLQIGRLLMASGMEPSGYASLALVYGRGKSRGLSHDRLVHEVIINTLSAGGGLAVMNQKIESTPIAEPLPAAKPAPAAGARHVRGPAAKGRKVQR